MDMKKLIGLTLLAVLAAGFVYAQTTVTNRGEVVTVYTGTDMGDRTRTEDQKQYIQEDVVMERGLLVKRELTVTGAATVGGSAAVTAATLTKADTNATTTVTGYKPDFAGQVLLGGAGTGTNGVWISKGTTTNDWVQVAP